MSYKDISSTTLYFSKSEKGEKNTPWMDTAIQGRTHDGCTMGTYQRQALERMWKEENEALLEKDKAIRDKLERYQKEEEEIEKLQQKKLEERARLLAELNDRAGKKDKKKDKKKDQKEDKKTKKKKKKKLKKGSSSDSSLKESASGEAGNAKKKSSEVKDNHEALEKGEEKEELSEEALAAKLRQEKLDAELKKFREEQLRMNEVALMAQEAAREKRAAAMFGEVGESAPAAKATTEDQSKGAESVVPARKVFEIKKKDAPFLSFDAVALPSSEEKLKKAKAEAEQRKKQKEEEEAKMKAEISEEKREEERKRREAVWQWKQERAETKRKADAEEAMYLLKRAKLNPATAQFAAGFELGEKVELVNSIKEKGKIVVMKQENGVIVGPSELDPKEKLRVQFGFTEHVVVPMDIKRPGGLPGGKEKIQDLHEKWRQDARQRKKDKMGGAWHPQAHVDIL